MKRVVGLVVGLSLVVPVIRYETGLMENAANVFDTDRVVAPSIIVEPMERFTGLLAD